MLAWAGAASLSGKSGGEKEATPPQQKHQHEEKEKQRRRDSHKRRDERALATKGRDGSLAAAPRGTQSLGALTALGTVAVYTSIRGGITVFHHARRKFLRQLLQVGARGTCHRPPPPPARPASHICLPVCPRA
jgi:hypothetical protein